MVKVLILHQHFKTPERGGALRSYYLAKALVDHGIETIVVTAHNEPKKAIVTVDGITVYYLPITYDNKFGFLKRSISFINYIVKSISLSKQFKDVDICYAISVPITIGLVALWIKRRYKIPYIFEVGDLWPEAPIQMGVIRNYFFKQALYRLERLVYQQAQAIVAVSPMIKKEIAKVSGDIPIHIIPNMADINYFRPAQKKVAIQKKFNVDGKFVIAYVGALGAANGLDHFLKCARACAYAKLPIQFLLCGEGAMQAHLQIEIQSLNLQNASLIPFTNKEGVREVLHIADAVFVSYKPLPVLETGSPNKYFDGLAAGKLIIINFGGWIKEEIEATQCGFHVSTNNPDEIASKIIPFLEDPTLLQRYQRNARRLAESTYAREIISNKFVSLFLGN